MQVGFAFTYYDITVLDQTPFIIAHKYSFVERNGDRDVYLSEDKTWRLHILDNPTSSDDKTHYIIGLYDTIKHTNTLISQ